MGEFVDVVRSRRMTRAYRSDPLADGTIERLVALANRAPSAGKTQGWHVVALEGEQTARFWDVTLPPMRRGAFKWQGLLDAPVILLPFADPKAYVDRYAEPDKAATGSRRERGCLARPVLDDRRVDVGHDAAARSRGRGPRRTVLRGLQG